MQGIFRILKAPALISLMLLVSGSLSGQFDTPTIDGNISSGEYGNHTNGQNQETHPGGSQIWYMTWNNDSLYIGITQSNVNEGAVIYIDVDPIEPINGGNNTNGTLNGQPYDNTNFAELQFRADFVAYFKNGLRAYRNDDGSNGWAAETTGFGNYSDDGSNLREIAIPWSAVTGSGRPASFNWFGYVTSSGGSVYAQMPIENNGGNIGTSARWERYYEVESTADGSSTEPFSRNCFVSNITSNTTGFGAIQVFNYTMNDTGLSLTRANTGTDDWEIAGKMLITGGTIDFGASSSNCDVDGNVEIGDNGSLLLSTSFGGDITVGDSFIVAGTFQCNDRAVVFDGNGQTNLQTISGSGSITIDYFRIANKQNVELNTNVTVADTLDFQFNGTGGKLILNDYDVTLDSIADATDYDGSHYVVTNSAGKMVLDSIPPGRQDTFPIGPSISSYNPIYFGNNSSSSMQNFAFNVCEELRSNGSCNSGTIYNSEVVRRTWMYEVPNYSSGALNVNVEFQWDGSLEASGFNRSNTMINKYDGSSWATEFPTSANGSNPYTAILLGYPDPDVEFGLSSTNLNNLLPLDFLTFTARENEGTADLHWQVAEVVNVSHFEVEHSTNGQIFQKIGSKELGYNKTDYYFSHKFPYRGTNYYRIKSVDDDGQVQYSKVEAVNLSANADIKVYRSEAAQLTVERNNNISSPQRVEVYNLLGQQLLTNIINSAHTTIRIPDNSGTVLVKVGGEGFLVK